MSSLWFDSGHLATSAPFHDVSNEQRSKLVNDCRDSRSEKLVIPSINSDIPSDQGNVAIGVQANRLEEWVDGIEKGITSSTNDELK